MGKRGISGWMVRALEQRRDVTDRWIDDTITPHRDLPVGIDGGSCALDGGGRRVGDYSDTLRCLAPPTFARQMQDR